MCVSGEESTPSGIRTRPQGLRRPPQPLRRWAEGGSLGYLQGVQCEATAPGDHSQSKGSSPPAGPQAPIKGPRFRDRARRDSEKRRGRLSVRVPTLWVHPSGTYASPSCSGLGAAPNGCRSNRPWGKTGPNAWRPPRVLVHVSNTPTLPQVPGPSTGFPTSF